MENHRRIEMANDKILIVALIVALTAVALILLPIALNQTHAASLSLSKKKDKDNGDLTIVLTLKYGLLDGKYYKKVVLRIADDYEKTFDLSHKPDKVTINGLDIKEGTKFWVNVDNYGTDEGEQIQMKNTKCNCKEVGTIRVP